MFHLLMTTLSYPAGFTVISPAPRFAYQSSPTLSSFRLLKIIQV